MSTYLEKFAHMALVDQLAEHERSVGRLYDAYAARFPAQADFWHQLAHEEEGHAELLGRLNSKLRADKATLDDGWVDPRQVVAAIEFADNQAALAASAPAPELQPMQALLIAHGIEKHMVEEGAFKSFTAGAGEEKLQETLHRLARHTREHIARIEKEMDACRRQKPPRKSFLSGLFGRP